MQACAPYFEKLEKWIYKGIIQDPYAEVMNKICVLIVRILLHSAVQINVYMFTYVICS